MPRGSARPLAVALVHGAGYAGRELIRILTAHPRVELVAVTSRTFANRPIHVAHPELRGVSDLCFIDPAALDPSSLDGILLAAEHGQGARTAAQLIGSGFEGALVDLSADFRFSDARRYAQWYRMEHAAPELLGTFDYGLTEICAPYQKQRIANPGCFATGIALALRPLQDLTSSYHAAITAVTGASGSGTRPKTVTHFPTRDSNMRAYKVLCHQHLPEVAQVLSEHVTLSLVPVSGPWTRGIWGAIHAAASEDLPPDAVASAYASWYGDKPLVRLWPGALPELRFAAGTPFCDIGWVQHEDSLVVGFALDNLLKGAASQAVQNLNIVLGLPEAAGLLPDGR